MRKFNPKAFQPTSRHTRAVLLLLKYPKAGWSQEEEVVTAECRFEVLHVWAYFFP